MATVKGQNLRIYLGNGDSLPIASALSCQLQVQLSVQEKSTKDDEGGWVRNQAVSLSWSATAQAAVINDEHVGAIGYDDILDMIGQTVYVRLAMASGTQNREQGDILVAGYAILSDVQMNAQNRQRSTYDIQLTGCKNLIQELRMLSSSNPSYLRTSDGHLLTAEHE